MLDVGRSMFDVHFLLVTFPQSIRRKNILALMGGWVNPGLPLNLIPPTHLVENVSDFKFRIFSLSPVAFSVPLYKACS